MKKLNLDPVRFLESFARAFHKDAHIVFKVENTRIRNKFRMMLAIGVRAEYNVKSAAKDCLIYASIDPIFKKVHPDLMLRDGIVVSIDDLAGKYGCSREAVAKAASLKIRQEFEYRDWLDGNRRRPTTFVATATSRSWSGATRLELRPAKTFEEFAVNLDLDAQA